MDNIIELYVRVPSYDTIRVKLLYLPNVTSGKHIVEAIQHYCISYQSSSALHIQPEHIRLFASPDGGRELLPHQLLFQHNIKHEDTLYIVTRMAASHDLTVSYLDLCYDQFIDRITLYALNDRYKTTEEISINNAVNVCPSTGIRISLKPSSFSYCLHVPSLFERETKTGPPVGRMVRELGGSMFDAKKRGYICWSDSYTPIAEHVLLLEANLSELSNASIGNSIDKIRYDMMGINHGYYSGDDESWQRYTNSPPIACKLTLEVDSGDGYSTLLLTPYSELSAGCTYILLLQNNAPIYPVASTLYSNDNGGSSYSYSSLLGVRRYTVEDKVYVFTTSQ